MYAVVCAKPATVVLKCSAKATPLQNCSCGYAGVGLWVVAVTLTVAEELSEQNLKYTFIRGLVYAAVKKVEISIFTLNHSGRAAAQFCRFYPVQTCLFTQV